ncbi:ABC transporter permease [Limibacterium fermenti]|uniref:ABC transporter permease n=1 Tax=Limibacterium fermenti TaxID=3229863 RepID=UPI000E9C6658|nr:hypothetical protein [Porphyromonadaceae bacterium]
MNIVQLNNKHIKAKFLSFFFNVLLFAGGITVISFIFLVSSNLEKQMNKNAAGVDLVVGAKGSPLQLVLSGLYHVDNPTGNIDYSEALKLTENPLIKRAVPLALGDNFKGFRIIGTEHSYVDLYKGNLQEGDLWKGNFEAAIGQKVAEKAGLKIGDTFAGVHGFIEQGGHAHNDHTYRVTGIFEPTGTVLDQLILTNIESVWEIHAHHHHGDEHDDDSHSHDGEEAGHDHHEHEAEALEHDGHEHEHEHDEAHGPGGGKEITLMLLQYTNPMGAMTLPRLINSSTNMQAAAPAMEINRLYALMGVGVQSLNVIAAFIIIISAFSIFISLINSLKERKYELALIRAMGGSRGKLFSLILLEGLSIAVAGYVLGFLLSRTAVWMLSRYTESNYHYALREWVTANDAYLLIVSLGIGLLSALIPALKAMQTPISKTLSE